MGESGIGASVLRKEDKRFLLGKGRYTDDINLPGQTYAVFVRSENLAHAKINSIDTEEAAAMDGVVAIFTGKDTEALGGLPCGWLIHSKDGSPMKEPKHSILCTDRVRHLGDQVAVVIAETKEQAKAAAAAVWVDYEELPVAASISAALDDGAPQIWEEAPGNVCYDWEIGDKAATEAAFQNAAHTVSIDLTNNRVVPNAMEPRAYIGSFDPAREEYTVYTTSQNPHLIRLLMSAFVLQIPEHKLRIVAPDVGGGFGSKIFHYAEEAVVTWASGQIGRPIKWTAERTESFLTDAHGRDHISHAELALDADHKFIGMKVSTKANMGAYLSTFASSVPTWLYAPLLSGVYTFPAIYCEVKSVFSNTAPVDAYRGAGRPEATYLLERLVTKAAKQLGVDQVELRRKNMIQPEQMPFQTCLAFEYDTGDFPATLDMALEAIDWSGFEARKAESAARGKLRGIGISTYVEACGIAPSAMAGAIGARAGLYESAIVRVHPTGSVTVFTGTKNHGQGHETAFAQIINEKLGVPLESIEIDNGDSSKTTFGMGSYGSRSLAVGGSAIAQATDKVIEKGRRIAAAMLEASADDIEFADGNYTVKGTDKAVPFAAVAFTCYVPHEPFPHATEEPGLEETAFYDPKNFTFPGGTHICEVEVDPDTGVVQVLDMAVADDVGTIVNPMIVDGQVHGGLAQGIGQALMEQALYDEAGQLMTNSYMNYTMPRAADFPFFKVGMHTTPCTHNPLGAKGVGEVGAIGCPPAVINAVLDALEPLGVSHIDMPATPPRVWQAIQDAKAAAAE
jgi:carbon-monoxide dehydrogenase large subunit